MAILHEPYNTEFVVLRMKALLAWQIRIAQVAQKKLSERQLIEFNEALRRPPRNFGLNTNIWEDKTLSSFIKQQYNIDLGVRQSQRLIRRLGIRLRKQRPVIAKPDPDQQKMHKKNREDCANRFSLNFLPPYSPELNPIDKSGN